MKQNNKIEKLSDVRKALREKEKPQRKEKKKEYHLLGTLQIVTLLVLILVLGGGIFYFRDEINLYSIKRMFSVFSFSQNSVESFTAIPLSYDTALSPIFATEGEKLICVTGDRISIVDFNGQTIYDEKVMFTMPAVSVSGKYTLIYDRGGREIRLFSGTVLSLKKTLDKPINTAEVNKYGEFAVITGADGYKSLVTIFNRDHKEIYKWHSAERYVSEVVLSDKGTEFAAVSLATEAGDISSRLTFFKTDQEEPICYTDFKGELVCAADYQKDGSITVLSDQTAYRFESNGTLTKSFSYFGRKLQQFDLSAGRTTTLVLNRLQFGSATNLVILDSEMKPVCDTYIGNEVTSLTANDRRVLLFDGKNITVYNALGEWMKQVEAPHDTRRILQNDVMGAVAILVDRAESVPIP